MAHVRKNFRSEVLSFVECFVKDNGYPPTLDEIRESVGLSSKSHVGYYLDALEEEGLIEREPRTPRGLRLVGFSQPTFEINAKGTFATGRTPELADDPGQEIQLTSDVTYPRKDLRGMVGTDDLVMNG